MTIITDQMNERIQSHQWEMIFMKTSMIYGQKNGVHLKKIFQSMLEWNMLQK